MKSDIIKFDYGWQLSVFDTATSTSDIIFSLDDIKEGVAILARQQTAGRGRHGRSWTSNIDDGMYLSLALRPQRAVKEWPSLSFVTALSLVDAIKQLTPHMPIGLKWPNDILVDNRKISGILLEAKQDLLVIGCGVNLKNAPHVKDAKFAPTDIFAQSNILISPQELATRFLNKFHQLYQDWQHAGFSSHIDLYKSQLLFMSQRVSVSQGHNKISGIMRGISQQGDLLIEGDNGDIISLSTGDVNLVGQIDAISN